MSESTVRTYTIGSRGSLLALTQARFIKACLETNSPHTFNILPITTQGDQITNVPLWQLEGKDFFTRELDDALLNKSVDLVVHSYKDLGSERPAGITLGAVTERAFCHDILLLKKSTKKKLLEGNFEGPFIVGTSAPRRIVNLEGHLGEFLPHSKSGQPVEVKTSILRGNINTRIKKVQPEEGEPEYHAITLALAGLTRLSADLQSSLKLQDLLIGLDFMILPRTYFPGAAAQGALAIEFRDTIVSEDRGTLIKLLKELEHAETARVIRSEREIFKSFGGGCHLAVGIYCAMAENQEIHSIKGQVDGKKIEHFYVRKALPQLPDDTRFFLGMRDVAGEKDPNTLYDELVQIEPSQYFLPNQAKILVASKHACPKPEEVTSGHVLFASGANTARVLAKQGLWVSATADFGGEKELMHLLKSPVFKLLIQEKNFYQNYVCTHSSSKSAFGPVIPMYKRFFKVPNQEFVQKLKACSIFYWSSHPQYQFYSECVPEIKNGQHFCGLGKTYQDFTAQNIVVTPLTGVKEFKNWIGGRRHVYLS